MNDWWTTLSCWLIAILAGWKLVELIGWCFWTAFRHYYGGGN